MQQAVCVKNITKTFGLSRKALKNVSIQVEEGEMIALIGASGSGKSTLLRHISGLVECDCTANSEVSIFGKVMQKNGRIASGARHLRTDVGVIFQQFNLVGRLRVLTNVLMGNLGQMSWWKGCLGIFGRAQKIKAMQALQRVGIMSQAMQRGSTLSGGQQQRAAIARTLVQGAKLLIADEPIASLDPSAARKVMDILSDLNRNDNITIMVSLHQVEYALNYCPRTIALRDGEIVYDGSSEALTAEFLAELYGSESEELFLPGLKEKTWEDKRKEPVPVFELAVA